MEIKGSNVNSKLKIKEDLQIGKKLAKEIMLFADDNSSAVSKKEFQNKLNRMKKLSTQDLIKFIRSFDKDESIIELIIDEVGSSKQERKDACKKVLSALTNKAKELGIDTKDFEQQFIKELDHQFNSWGTVNTEKLDKIINAIVQSIENRQNFTAEDVQIVQNTPVEVGQEQANAVIENRLENANSAFGERVGENGEMTDKHEVQVPIVDDEGNPTGKFETKVETYNGQMQRDGIAADIADGFSKIWNNELYGNENGNTADLVRRDLKIMSKQLQELKEAKTQGEEAYKAKFKEIFGVEYDYANILAYQKAEATYINASSNYEFEMTFNRTLKTLLSPAPLREEIKTIYTGDIYINQTTATKEQVYSREFNNLAEFLTQKDSKGNEIKGSEILNKAFEEKGVANGTIEEKFEVLKQIAQALSKELHKSTLEAGNGKEFSEVQAMYDNSYKAAYGVENDIMKRVTDYNVSQEMGAGVVKAGVTIAVSLVAAFTGVGLVGVAAWTAGATVATEVIDRGTSGNALNALREQGLGEYLETVGKDVDWEATLKQAAMSGGAVLIGGGVAQGVTAIMKGSSSVAQFAAMLGSDVITDATMEFFMTKQITWEGMVFTVLLSTIGNAAQLKQMKNAATTNAAKGVDSGFDNARCKTQNLFTRGIDKVQNWIAPVYEGNGFTYRTSFWGKKYNFKLAENDNAKVNFLIQNKKMANPNPTNLTNELERVFYYRLGVKNLLDSNPNLSRIVGSLPQRWGKILGKEGLNSIDDILYSFSKNFYNTNKISQNDLIMLETNLSNILNKKVKIKYIGQGEIGVALNITVDGQSYVLKVFKKDIKEQYLHNHGNYAELSAAVYASKNDPNHFAKFYFGRFGDNNDGYMITKFLQSESDVANEKFTFRNSIHKLNSSDSHSGNMIANRIIDYGSPSLSYTSNFTTEEMKILRRLTEALDNNSETEVLKIIKEFENNPNFNNPKQFIKFLIDNESMTSIGSKVGRDGSRETVYAADYFKEREKVLSLLGINSVPDIKVYSRKYNPDCHYWLSPDMAKHYDLTLKEWNVLDKILRSE